MSLPDFSKRSFFARQFRESFHDRTIKILEKDKNISVFPSTLFRSAQMYYDQAVDSFLKKLFLACIGLSSTLIEIVLKNDRKMKRVLKGEWTLNRELFNKALNCGLPIKKLLDIDEIERFSVDSKYKPRFIKMRDKFLHGELEGYLSELPKYKSQYGEFAVLELQLLAFEQITKAQDFLLDYNKQIAE